MLTYIFTRHANLISEKFPPCCMYIFFYSRLFIENDRVACRGVFRDNFSFHIINNIQGEGANMFPRILDPTT